jgi:hypothetical protein
MVSTRSGAELGETLKLGLGLSKIRLEAIGSLDGTSTSILKETSEMRKRVK